MDNIDSLIKKLKEFQEELNKNMNTSYGTTPPNMTKEEMDKAASKAPQSSPVVGIPAEHVKAVKIKNLQRQIEGGTYKPDANKIADKMLKEELTCSENGQWNIVEKSIYNTGTHPMKGRESKRGNFPHYDYDTSAPHEENIKQAKAHFNQHKISLNDNQFNAHIKQAKIKAQQQEK